MKTTFSVIIPVYNVENYLAECVESVLAQQYEEIEILLIDDGSTDHSSQICDDYVKKDSRVHVVHKKNEGLSAARNEGIKIAKGDYILFLDSDDFWREQFLHKMDQKIEDTKANAVVFNYCMNQDGRFSKDILDLEIIKSQSMGSEQALIQLLSSQVTYPWYVWLYAIKRAVLVENELWFPVGELYEDVAWTWKMLLKAEKIAIFPYSVLAYRVGRPKAITSTISFFTEACKIKIIRRNISDVLKSPMNAELKEKLCDNFSCLFTSVLIFYFYLDKRDRKKLFPEIKSNIDVLQYSYSRKNKLLYFLIKILPLKLVCMLLYIRSKRTHKRRL